ncbi:MAG: acetyl-CoA decarbonylase/synthase complex subunit gamma [Candidatus Odinarchaeota archaeon]
MPKVEPIQILKMLPQTNCKKCGETTCLAFAAKLASRDIEVIACTPLFEEDKYAGKREKLLEALMMPIRPLKFGPPGAMRMIGGEEVLHRHELTYHNETALLIALDDSMSESKLFEEIDRLQNLVFTRIGKDLKIDGFCIRSTSQDPEQFKQRVKSARSKTNLPICLASLDPAVIRAGLEVEAINKPLIYAATVDNWQAMLELAKEFNVPVVLATGSGDLDELVKLAKTFEAADVEIVLDPGTWINEGWLGKGFRNKIELRRSAVAGDVKTIGYPFMAVPAITKIHLKTPKADAKQFKESILACLLMEKYADIMILSSTPDLWPLMPILTFRQSLYSDPRIHPAVEPGLTEINNPNDKSPVCISTNFALTYYTIKSDFESQKLGTWLLVVDTGGLGVEAAVAGGQLTTDKIVDLMNETKIADKVAHKKIVLPGLAARLSGEMEDASGWQITVGPKDSADIKKVYERWSA